MSAQLHLIVELAEKMAYEKLPDRRLVIFRAIARIYRNGGSPSHKMQDEVRAQFGLRHRTEPKQPIMIPENVVVAVIPAPVPVPVPIPSSTVSRERLMFERVCVHCETLLVLEGDRYVCVRCRARETASPEPQPPIEVPAVAFLDAPNRVASGPGTNLYTRNGTSKTG